MKIEKARVLEVLRSRGLDARAEFADRNLPDVIDVKTNAGLLATLGLDIADFSDIAELSSSEAST